jgi:DNA-nicking Smr family endonuclease
MRRLGAEEKALWEKVVASVRPLHARQKTLAEKPEPVSVEPPLAEKPRVIARPQPRAAAPKPGVTLDAGWDRRLARGVVQPDIVVDLHGHNLAKAYHLLDLKLEQAVAMDARVMLLVTGKPPSDERRPGQRGAIRAAVGDWLSASRHAAHIAAVRNAHPRHGGAGALYIILRRRRGA